MGHCERRCSLLKQPPPTTIDAWVLLPDHLHCIWNLAPDIDYNNLLTLALKSGNYP
jgi:REP element-mobilizing transposase RayT